MKELNKHYDQTPAEQAEDLSGMNPDEYLIVTGVGAALEDLKDAAHNAAQAGSDYPPMINTHNIIPFRPAEGIDHDALADQMGWSDADQIISDAPVINYDDPYEVDLARRLGIEGVNPPEIRLEGDL
jgi:hypothetical protein